MTLRLIQLRAVDGERLIDGSARRVRGAHSTLGLANEAIQTGATLASIVETRGLAEDIDLSAALQQQRILPPVLPKEEC